MKTHVTLQVALTEADISQNLTISIFLGTVETNFIQIMWEKRDRSTPEVSVFGSENSFAYPRWRFLQARNFYKDFLKKYFVRGCGHFSEV
jgi:hypothetical protein